MAALAAGYLQSLVLRNYSQHTIRTRRAYLGYFSAWCAERGISQAGEVSRAVLERYQRWLYHYRKKNGGALTFRSQHAHLVPVRGLFKWLAREHHILYNPASELELPRLEKRLPKYVLTASEADQILNQADVTTPLGIRDRAILETFYSTGMRRLELIGLKLYDLDAERGTVMIRQGKGKKDRMIPIGERAIAWIEKYLTEVRPTLIPEPDSGILFVTSSGEPFHPDHCSELVRELVDSAGIGKRGACHLFRHTMATLMLEGGADIRFIQQMLGHADISTTQIYTQVSIRKLKAIHTATHPGAQLGSRAAAGEPDTPEQGQLFSSLAAEAEED